MAKQTRQNYITIPYQDTKPEWVEGVSTEELLAAHGTKVAALGSVEVAYTFANIVTDLEGNASSCRRRREAVVGAPCKPRVLVAGYGDAAKRAVRMCIDANIEVYAVYAETEARTSYENPATDSNKIA